MSLSMLLGLKLRNSIISIEGIKNIFKIKMRSQKIWSSTQCGFASAYHPAATGSKPPVLTYLIVLLYINLFKIAIFGNFLFQHLVTLGMTQFKTPTQEMPTQVYKESNLAKVDNGRCVCRRRKMFKGSFSTFAKKFASCCAIEDEKYFSQSKTT